MFSHGDCVLFLYFCTYNVCAEVVLPPNCGVVVVLPPNFSYEYNVGKCTSEDC